MRLDACLTTICFCCCMLLLLCVVFCCRVLARCHFGSEQCVREALAVGAAAYAPPCAPARLVLGYLGNLYDISAHVREQVCAATTTTTTIVIAQHKHTGIIVCQHCRSSLSSLLLSLLLCVRGDLFSRRCRQRLSARLPPSWGCETARP